MRELVLTVDELALLIAFVSKLDPDEYPSENAKAMIYKSRGILKSWPERVRIV